MISKKNTILYFAIILSNGLAFASDTDDFTRLDVDLDGQLSETEFSKLSSDRGGQRGGRSRSPIEQFAEADSNGDGFLSTSEFSALRIKRASRDRS